ncbi:MAG: hypothetical protein M0Q51_08320 [Bacteroidales bacterium]|nr:hypothetical protein [Bacteroidales bacterium]
MFRKLSTLTIWFTWLIGLLIFSSCKTSVFVANSTIDRIIPDKEFLIIHNSKSNIFPAGIYPNYKQIDQFVFTSKPSIQRIDSLIYNELVKFHISCEITNEQNLLNAHPNTNEYIIKYQDYWSWDFKPFMHILIISIYDTSNNKLSEYVSQGNTAGLHNFPTPAKQVPELIALILRE